MANLTVQSVSRAGLNPSFGAAAGGGDTFLPSDETFLYVKNASGVSVTVTVVTPGSVIPDVAIADVAVAVPAGQDRVIGPFPAQFFADPTDGLADITYSAVTSVTVAAIQLKQP